MASLKTKVGVAVTASAAVLISALTLLSPSGDIETWWEHIDTVPFTVIEYVKISATLPPAADVVAADVVAPAAPTPDAGDTVPETSLPVVPDKPNIVMRDVGAATIKVQKMVAVSLPPTGKSRRKTAKNWRKTAETKAVVRSAVSPTPWFMAVGRYDARHGFKHTQFRKQYEFINIGPDWQTAFHRRSLRQAKYSVCVIDSDIGRFDGPSIEEFVRECQVREAVLSWTLANNIEHLEYLEQMVCDIEGTLEYIKRGNPDCFVWVTVCVATRGMERWAGAIKDLPFDGVALWGPYYIPKGEGVSFLAAPLKWAKREFRDRPVALAGFFAVKNAEHNAEAALRAPEAAKQGVLAARVAGYDAIWLQNGLHPDRTYWEVK